MYWNWILTALVIGLATFVARAAAPRAPRPCPVSSRHRRRGPDETPR